MADLRCHGDIVITCDLIDLRAEVVDRIGVFERHLARVIRWRVRHEDVQADLTQLGLRHPGVILCRNHQRGRVQGILQTIGLVAKGNHIKRGAGSREQHDQNQCCHHGQVAALAETKLRQHRQLPSNPLPRRKRRGQIYYVQMHIFIKMLGTVISNVDQPARRAGYESCKHMTSSVPGSCLV